MNRRILYCICATLFAVLLIILFILKIDRSAPIVSFKIVEPKSIHSLRDIQIEVHVSDDQRIDPSIHYDVAGLFGLGISDITSNKKKFIHTIDFKNFTDDTVNQLITKGIFDVMVTVHDMSGKTTTQSFRIDLSEVIQ